MTTRAAASMGLLVLALLAPTLACGGEAKAPTPRPARASTASKAVTSEAVTEVRAMDVLDLEGLRADIARSGAKVTVVALWATWCAPCIEEMPALAEFFEAHRAEGLRVVGLCTDDRAELGDQIQRVLDKTRVPYKQALLKPGTEEAFFGALGHPWDGTLPKTVVFDAGGKEIAYFSAAVDGAVLTDKVAPLLGK